MKKQAANGVTPLDLASLGVLVTDGDIRLAFYDGLWHWSIVDSDEKLIVKSTDRWVETGFLRLVKLYEGWRFENRNEFSKKSSSA